LSVYGEEFSTTALADRPKLLLLVITDGEAEDTDEFVQKLTQMSGGMYTEIAIVGYGAEHDRALRAYQQVATHNAHVRITNFNSETNPQVIADALLGMMA
jgi:hypothetical protein